jgi:pilus assembly protein CpaF
VTGSRGHAAGEVAGEGAIDRCIRAGRLPEPGVLGEVVADEEPRLGDRGSRRARAELHARYLGLGPLEGVVGDPSVTDVLVNGSGAVWVDRGDGLARVPGADIPGPAAVRRLATRLADQAGRRLDDSQPWVDGLLASGVRLHAILPPIVEDGPHICLRVPRRSAATLPDLVRAGMFDTRTQEDLSRLVEQRTAFVVSGGTGTGKTTLLGALLSQVSSRERIVVVEDVRELAVDHPHVVRLQTRPANLEGVGRVAMVDLVRQALRMRPDRLVVGEVRGGEVRELLAALNTGHEGGCGTLHANRPGDVRSRFEALGAPAGMSPAAVRAQLASAVRVVVHLERDAIGRRRVVSVERLSVGEPWQS